MKRLLFVFLLGMSCQKADVQQEFITKDFFYRLRAFDAGGAVLDSSYIVTTKMSVGSITGEFRGEAYTDEPPHYDGDGCDEKSDKFCKKHPWHKKCQVLGLKVTEFNVQKNSNFILVFWKLENEGSIASFSVDRSEDGKTWATRGKVKANGSDLFYTHKDYNR